MAKIKYSFSDEANYEIIKGYENSEFKEAVFIFGDILELEIKNLHIDRECEYSEVDYRIRRYPVTLFV